MKTSKKILCIQLRQLGDVLMTTAAVRTLSENYLNADIDFLTEAPGDQIYEYNPHISRVIKIKRKNSIVEWLKLAAGLRKSKYDLVIDFIGMPKTAILGWLSGAPLRIGFNFRGRTFFYTDVVDMPKDVYYAPLHKMRLLSALGISSDNSSIEFHLSDEDRDNAAKILKQVGAEAYRPLVTISPVSRREYKVWPPERFALLCDHLIRKYEAQILFLWGPGEYSFIKDVRNAMSETSLPDYEVPTLRETSALCELADLHIGNDNGPMHFAIAAGAPTVSIFGQPYPANWTPPGSEKNLSVEFDPGCKSNCHHPDCKMECIKEVPVEKVMSAVEAQIKRIGGKFKKGDIL